MSKKDLAFSALTLLVRRQEGHPARKKYGGWWGWALVSPDGVAPSRMVSVSASVNLPLYHKVQKFSSGTGSPGQSRTKGRKMVACVCVCGCVCVSKQDLIHLLEARKQLRLVTGTGLYFARTEVQSIVISCMSVFLLAYLKNHTFKCHKIFCMCCLRLWLGLTTMEYVMYFRLCGCDVFQ